MVRQMLLDAKEDLTAFAVFPLQHWKEIQSTNPLERINREIKRRTDVVQVSPQPRRPRATDHRRARRDARRMDRLPPPLPTRRQHDRAPHRKPDHRPATRPYTTPGDMAAIRATSSAAASPTPASPRPR